MTTLLLAFLGTAIFWQPVVAWTWSAPETQLVEGAKKENKLVLYITMDIPQAIGVINDFLEKYPFLGVELHPREAERLVKKIQNEARGGMSNWDVLIGGGGLFQPLLDEKLVTSSFA